MMTLSMHRTPLQSRLLTVLGLILIGGLSLADAAQAKQASRLPVSPEQASPSRSTVERTARSTPVRQGLPGRRTGAATRDAQNSVTGFLVLAPQDTPWLSLADEPSLLVYRGSDYFNSQLEVIVEDAQGNLLYDQLITLPPQAGFYKLALGELQQAQALNSQQDYTWHVSLIVDPSNRSRDLYEQGTLRRTSLDHWLSAAEQNQWATASPLEKAQQLQALGLWQEAAIALYDLSQDASLSPGQQAQVQQQWQQLLQSLDLDPWIDSTLSRSS